MNKNKYIYITVVTFWYLVILVKLLMTLLLLSIIVDPHGYFDYLYAIIIDKLYYGLFCLYYLKFNIMMMICHFLLFLHFTSKTLHTVLCWSAKSLILPACVYVDIVSCIFFYLQQWNNKAQFISKLCYSNFTSAHWIDNMCKYHHSERAG